ncbi:gamma-glutamylcyclotransferase family protein [Pseudopelagicola sp. nBUS_19]|uniref:gamma-glutamylcyclotransferase family protein n=1 Tax=Pseudopelagicola sp. nBUS_19 TaxID=3395316 RepID=UPI003EBA6783
MGLKYFAYGSNMLPARLQARCSTARVIGTATARNFGLEFSKPSKDGSGKATLIESTFQELATPGVLFEIEKTELRQLDRAEGAGYGYDRDDGFRVTCASTGETVTATTYLASTADPKLKPFDWYLALVLAGSHHHNLHVDHLMRLRDAVRANMLEAGKAVF